MVDGELGFFSGDVVGDVGGSYVWWGLGCVGYVFWWKCLWDISCCLNEFLGCLRE